MTVYDQIISRDVSNDPLVPTPVSAEIIKELPTMSAALRLARTVPMSSKSQRQPVLATKPAAYWVSGDTGLKKTSSADWSNLELVAEELAVIIPVPEAYFDDSQVPIWGEVRPLLVEAIGMKLDQAVLFGTEKPASWTSAAIIPGAIAATNEVVSGTGADLGIDIASMGETLAGQGFNLRSFAARPGYHWNLIGQRTADGDPIYHAGSIANGSPDGLYGRPMYEVDNGSWDTAEADLVGGDFSKAVVGIRQDITFKVFTEGVISDADGKVILNLMQQDSVAMRVVFRCGYVLANPVTQLESNAANRFPFAVLTPPVP